MQASSKSDGWLCEPPEITIVIRSIIQRLIKGYSLLKIVWHMALCDLCVGNKTDVFTAFDFDSDALYMQLFLTHT